MVVANYDRANLAMKISGHAQGGPKGEDIICAAASILSFTLIECVMANKEKNFPHISQIDGEIRVECRPETTWWKQECRRLMDVIFTGYEILAVEYPNNVRAEKEEA